MAAVGGLALFGAIIPTGDPQMRIEFLDDEYKRALLTKGWLRKKSTIVVYRDDSWWHEATGVQLVGNHNGSSMSHVMKQAERDARANVAQFESDSSWTGTLPPLPEARCLTKTTSDW